MKKRDFRNRSSESPQYPTVDDLELGRRRFVKDLGFVLGASALGLNVVACSSDGSSGDGNDDEGDWGYLSDGVAPYDHGAYIEDADAQSGQDEDLQFLDEPDLGDDADSSYNDLDLNDVDESDVNDVDESDVNDVDPEHEPDG